MSSPRPSLLVNLGLACAVSVLFAVVLEGTARLLEPAAPARAEGQIWSWREWRGQFYTLKADPSLWPIQRRFNADGLRDRVHPPEKGPGVFRVAVLGDSVTYGDGIAPREAFPQVLEARLREQGVSVEVLNVALPGWSTRQERIAYERVVRRYRPDLVLLAVCLNDITELAHNLRPPPDWLLTLHARSALVRRLTNAHGLEVRSVEDLFHDDAAARAKLQVFQEELQALASATGRDEVRLAVIVFPFAFQLAPDAPQPVVQRHILEACAARGLTCVDALPWVRDLGAATFRDHDHFTPAGAARVALRLAESGLLPAGPSADDVLREAGVDAGAGLRHAAPAVRAAAAFALGETGPAQALGEALADPDGAVRLAAARALFRLGPAAREAARALFAALRDPEQAVRWEAAQALDQAGLPLSETLPELRAALRSDDRLVREFSAATLGAGGPAAAEAVPDLLAGLDREEAFHEAGPAVALGRIGAAAAAAIPGLRRGLAAEDPEIRFRAARALGGLGPAAQEATGDLIARLADSDAKVRRHAARALGEIGTPAQAAASELARLAASDPDDDVREQAAGALQRVRGH
jgi:HEAT repeat protein